MRLFFLIRLLLLSWKSSPSLINAFQSLPPYQNFKYHTTAATTSSLSSIPNSFDVFTSGLASICRLPKGITVIDKYNEEENESNNSKEVEDELSLLLYDVENDANCRLVRERLTELNLNYRVVPAVSKSRAVTNSSYKYYSSKIAVLPALMINNEVRENSNNNQEESVEDEGKVFISGASEILEYLDKTYNSAAATTIVGKEKENETMNQATDIIYNFGNLIASILRGGRGNEVSLAADDDNSYLPLIMYNYEGNQFCRLVREVLMELDLVYDCRSAGKKSPRRMELAKITGGSSQCPYLIDPNRNNEGLADSSDIIAYLYRYYGKYTPPDRTLNLLSETILPLAKPLLGAVAQWQGEPESEKETPLAMEKKKEEVAEELDAEISSAPIVVYTYDWSPFSSECKALLDRLLLNTTTNGEEYKEISLGKEWIPGLIDQPMKRSILLERTSQSSLPHIFINGKSIGGLFDGTPGLVPSLQDGSFWNIYKNNEDTLLPQQ